MSWAVADEWINLEKSEHVVLFRNSDTKAEHQLIYPFGIWQCATCGHPKETPAIDFAAHKANVLTQLEADHKSRVAAHIEKHRGVRFGTGPKR